MKRLAVVTACWVAGLIVGPWSPSALAAPVTTDGPPDATVVDEVGVNLGELPAGVSSSDLGLRVRSMTQRRVPGPSKKGGTYVAKILINSAVYRRPGGKGAFWKARIRTKWSGASQRLMVLESKVVKGRLWLRVKLPIRPNTSSGWISRDRVRLLHSPRFIEVDRSKRLTKVYGPKGVISRFRVVVGAERTPTPLGIFALHDRVRQSDPNGFIGPWAVHLTSHSNVLKRYDGGPGRIAFHGRDGASLLDPLGTASSNGCLRMNNNRIQMIRKLPMGTAVRVRR